MEFDKDYTLRVLKDILQIDSPSGYTKNVMKKIEKYANELDLSFSLTQKGNGIIDVPGKLSSKTIGVAVHVDTLGAMVRSIKDNGRLAFTKVGGPILPTIDSEICKIYTRDGRSYTGTFYSTSPGAHVYEDASKKARNEDNMEVILDEVVKNKDDVLALGIDNGDYICIDPKTVMTETGFVKSRFLDDKLSVAIILSVLKTFHDLHLQPHYHIQVLISTYEEVGHGMSYIPSEIDEMLVVDMGCVGKDLACDEYKVSICAQDSSGPYDYDMTTKLIQLAKKNHIDYAVDIYPMYSSDGSAALRGGHNIKVALIGSGIFASHGYERCHLDGIFNTVMLLSRYLLEN